MVRDAFLSSEMVRIDCQGLEKSDYKKIGCKLRVRIYSFSLSAKMRCMHLNINWLVMGSTFFLSVSDMSCDGNGSINILALFMQTVYMTWTLCLHM